MLCEVKMASKVTLSSIKPHGGLCFLSSCFILFWVWGVYIFFLEFYLSFVPIATSFIDSISDIEHLQIVLDLDETLICAYESSTLPAVIRNQAIEAGLKSFELECFSSDKVVSFSVTLYCFVFLSFSLTILPGYAAI